MKNRIRKLLLTAILIVASIPSWCADGYTFSANTVEGASMTFKVINESEKTCQVGEGFYNTSSILQDYEGKVTVPSSVNGYKVTCIGNYAFQGCSGLVSIDLPSSVTSIGYYAFYQCPGLTTVTIPSNVTSIGRLAFGDCSALTEISVASGNANYKSVNGVLFTSDGTTLMAYPKGKTGTSYVIPDGVTSIGEAAFYGCSVLVSIDLPSGVTTIGEFTFSGCSGLVSINLPSGVTSIGNYAFEGCSGLVSIDLPSGVTTIGEFTFSGCSGLVSINLPSGVTSIGQSAFSGCSGLVSINLPSGVTSIAPSTFAFCSGLISIDLPSGVTSIGPAAFRECSGLVSIDLPSGITSIGNRAFSDCSGLTSINIPSAVTYIGNYAFSGCSGLPSITIPSGVTSIGDEAFLGCSSLVSIDLPSSLTSIGQRAFSQCSGLVSIDLPSGITKIGQGVFSYCSGLVSINLPSGVTSIGDYAFSNCSSLKSIIIPEKVTAIGYCVFDRCFSLTSLTINCSNISTSGLFKGFTQLRNVTIGDNMTILYNETFSGCSNLESVTIGSGMEYIRTNAFKGCTRIKTIECDAAEPPYCYPNVFADIDASCKVIVPSASKEAYSNDEQWGKFLIQGPSIDLTDGSTFTGYSKEKNMEQITYSRTFKNTNWQAWYVPFEVELTSDLLSRFSFAKYAGTYVDENSDPSFFITIARLKAGDKLKANTPYFVQAKTASNTAQVISVANTTLKPAQETGFDMYSAEQKVSIRGVYSAKTATAGDCDWYAYGGGSYFKATAGAVLNPYRVYLTITERDDNPYGTSEVPNEIKVKLLGDDGATIIEEVQGAEGIQDAQIYDLSGRRIMKDKLDKGIYIIKGKKVLVK